MVKKRFKKSPMMEQEMGMPYIAHEQSKFFLTGWGSSKYSIMEACRRLKKRRFDVGCIIFEHIWPMDVSKLTRQLENKELIMVEGNATCQLGSLICQQTGIKYIASILKYDGRLISPEYIIKNAENIIG
jgi:2-oxoglutarate ferredoxin oxidoreductase subunit alpha